MHLRVDANSPIPIRWQLTEQLKHVIEGGDIPRGPRAAEHPGAGRLPRHQSEDGGARDRGSRAERARGGAAGARACSWPQLSHSPVPRPPRGLSEGRGDPRGGPRDDPDDAHNLEHSIANATLPNIARIEAGPAEGAALGRLVRRVHAIVCSTSAAERVQGLVGPTVPVIVDDRALGAAGLIVAQRKIWPAMVEDTSRGHIPARTAPE